MKNAIFFSKAKKDTHSPRLLALLRNTPFKHEFCYYCIDPDPITKKRNDDLLSILDITKVPTMYVNGEKYVGEEAFMWLQTKMRQLQTSGGDSYNYHEGFVPTPERPNGVMPGLPPMKPAGPVAPPYGMVPGVGHIPQMGMGGFSGMPPGHTQSAPGPMVPPGVSSTRVGSTGPGDAGAGGLHGGGSESSFADPFAPTDITGINSMGLERDQLLRMLNQPEHTKNDDGTTKSDEMLKNYMMMRDSQ